MKITKFNLILMLTLFLFTDAFCTAQEDKDQGATELLKYIPSYVPVASKSFQNVSSTFGYRKHPILHKRKFHSGIDIVAPKGTTVMATATGIVVNSSFTKGYGNYILIKHTSSLKTLYAHLWVNLVKTGDAVVQGQIIGLVGDTGMTTGPHLHYEVHIKDQKIDPFILWRQVLDQYSQHKV